METNVVTLDVREDLRAGREPFARIMEAVCRLGDGDALRIVAPFEPLPLIDLLTARGFRSGTEALGDGSFAVTFTSQAPVEGERLL